MVKTAADTRFTMKGVVVWILTHMYFKWVYNVEGFKEMDTCTSTLYSRC